MLKRFVGFAGMDERLAEHMPHGAIRWNAESDKVGFLFISPISKPAREAIDAYLQLNPRVGDVPLFAAPGPKQKKDKPAQAGPVLPIPRERAAKWLLRDERLAKQPKLLGGVPSLSPIVRN